VLIQEVPRTTEAAFWQRASAGVDTRAVAQVRATPSAHGGPALSIKLHDKIANDGHDRPLVKAYPADEWGPVAVGRRYGRYQRP
jgi:hypothetical protein